MNQCVSMQRSWHGWEAKEKTNVYPTPNQKHPLLLLFFLLDDFFSFLSLFWKGFWQIRRKMHWQRSWHFQVRHLWWNPSARVVEEHIFQLSFQSRKQSISPSSARLHHTIPYPFSYHTIPYPFSHSVHHGSLVCCRQDQRDYIGNLETFGNFWQICTQEDSEELLAINNLHSDIQCSWEFWWTSKSIDSTNVQNEI